MTAPAMLVMVVVVAAVLLGGIVIFSRSRLREKTAGTTAAGSDAYTGWTPALFVDSSSSNSGSDCSPGDAGCDAGGGDGGGGGGGD